MTGEHDGAVVGIGALLTHEQIDAAIALLSEAPDRAATEIS